MQDRESAEENLIYQIFFNPYQEHYPQKSIPGLIPPTIFING
jgi:hypothetical protein